MYSVKQKGIYRYIFWISLILFFGLLYAIVIFEKGDPDANIKTIYDVLWYTVVTLTTVGYGDFYPVTPVGKILGLFIILSSLGLLGYLIGSVTNKIRDYMEKKKEGFYGTSFADHFVIIGWDNFARQVTDQIIHAHNRVAIVTNNKIDIDLIAELYPKESVFCLFTDFNNYEGYQKVNINKAQAVFINFPDDTETLVFLLNMKKHYQNIDFIVSLNKPDLKETFRTIGIEKAISKNEIASKLVASYIFEPDVGKFTEDLISTSVNETDYDIQEYRVVASNPYLNKEYLDAFIDLKKKYNSVLLGISKLQDNKSNLIKNPSTGILIELGDYLVIVSSGISKRELEKDFGVREGVVSFEKD